MVRCYVRRARDAADARTEVLAAVSMRLHETDFPVTLSIEGPGTEVIGSRQVHVDAGTIRPEGVGTTVQYVWLPFASGGDVAFGHAQLQLRLPTGTVVFRFELLPSRLAEGLWTQMFEQVCSLADALATDWTVARGPRHHAGASRRAAFNAATASAQIDEEWAGLMSALERIARRPHTEFLPALPGRVDLRAIDGAPIATSDVAENVLVRKTVDRLSNVLNVLRQRIEVSRDDAREVVARHAGGRPEALERLEAQEHALSARVDVLDLRIAQLSRMGRRLPDAPARSGTIPLTPRVLQHRDYRQVTRLWRLLGHESFARMGPTLSALNSRRASTIYEYWVLLTLSEALTSMGFAAAPGAFGRALREDAFELQFHRDRPLVLARGDVELRIWYERVACLFPDPGTGRQYRRPAWHALRTAPPGMAPGFYSRGGPSTPDYWIEARSGTRVVGLVADAFFAPGVEPGGGEQDVDEFMVKKIRTVAGYAQDIVLVTETHELERAVRGLVIYCGDDSSVAVLERVADGLDLDIAPEFVPLRPDTRGDTSSRALQTLTGAVNRLLAAVSDGAN